MISVITPTVRPEGLALVEKALNRQTFEDFEWIIVSPLHNWGINSQIKNAYVLTEPPKKKDDVWSLNKGYNYAIKHANGELIVSWQDWTYANPDVLEKFWYHHTNEPKTLVTAVGNKYKDTTWTVQTWKDPRERTDQGTFYPCFFNDIEWNLCAVPKEALYAVGGFDEQLDKYFGMDGYSVLDRLNMTGGYDFKIDQTIRSYSLEHGRFDRWEELNAIHGPYDIRRKDYLINPKLSYL